MADLTRVTEEPLSEAGHRAVVSRSGAGACVVFSGVVRDHDHDRAVERLEYVAHPSAAGVLKLVADEIAADPRIYGVAVSHRVGVLEVGDAALVAAVSAAHRGEAFAAIERLVDEVKARLPVWKHQRYTDGTDDWVNCP